MSNRSVHPVGNSRMFPGNTRGFAGGGGVQIFDDPTTFASSVSWVAANQNLRDAISNIKIYGGTAGHQYYIQYADCSNAAGGLNRIIISDLTLGATVGRYQNNDGPTGHPSIIKFGNPYNVADFQNFVIWIDWSKLYVGSKTYTYAQSTIDQTSIISNVEVSKYLKKRLIKRTQSVTDLTELDAALALITASEYNNQEKIIIGAGEIALNDKVIPEFTEIQGAGIDVTILNNDSVTKPVLQVHDSSYIHDLTINSNQPQYCIHSDKVNLSFNTNNLIYQIFRNVKMYSNSDTALFGCGISAGQIIKLYNCSGSHDTPTVDAFPKSAFGVHNTKAITGGLPAKVYFDGCASADDKAVNISSLGSGQIDIAYFTNCSFLGYVEIHVGSNWLGTVYPLAKNQIEFDALLLSGSIKYKRVCDYMKVLRVTTANINESVVVSGTAVDAAFGTLTYRDGSDGLKGRVDGEIAIPYNVTVNSSVNAVSIGKRLGDCSAVNKTLVVTVGTTEITHTFSTNLTNATNVDILTAINTTISSIATISEYNIAWDDFPSWNKTTFTNTSATSILKGKLVVVGRMAIDTDVAANILGVTLDDIKPGATGLIVTKTHPIHTSWLGIASPTAGSFGVDADGVIDYTPDNILGTVDALGFFNFD